MEKQTELVGRAARTLWDYMLMRHSLQPADIIWALGSHDLRVADRVAELYHQGLAPLVVMSGGLGNFTEGVFAKSEADLFAERAVELGVPADHILVENKSTNTGENVRFTQALLKSSSMAVTQVIAVQKPYMERRTFATVAKQWPEVRVQVTSPLLGYDDYFTNEIPENKVRNILVGDFQRILEYPAKGFMIEQEVPTEAKEAWLVLVEAGYTGHMMV